MTKKEEIGLIEFDVDGVLNLNSPTAYRKVFGLALNAAGVELPGEVIDHRIELKWGSPMSEVYKELVKEEPRALKKALDFHREHSADIFDEMTSPVPGSGELLERLLSGNYRLALNTAADSRVLFGVTLPKCGIEPRLFNGGIFTADSLETGLRPKPEPDIANLIMKLNDIPPERTWMVGDSPCDVLTASYSGIEPVVPLTGNLTKDKAETEFSVKYIIDDVTHLETVLEGRYKITLGSIGRSGLRGMPMQTLA